MKRLFVLAISLSMSSMLLASSLSIPRDFEFMALNGKEIDSSFLTSKKALKLDVGEQRIAVKYNKVLRDDIGNDHSRVISDPIIIQLQVQDAMEYKLTPSKAIRKTSQGEKFIKDPEFKIVNQKAEQAVFSVQLLDTDDRGLIGNFTKNKSDDTTALVLQQTETANLAANEDMANEMLHHWWQQADLETQTKFAEWANEQLK